MQNYKSTHSLGLAFNTFALALALAFWLLNTWFLQESLSSKYTTRRALTLTAFHISPTNLQFSWTNRYYIYMEAENKAIIVIFIWKRNARLATSTTLDPSYLPLPFNPKNYRPLTKVFPIKLEQIAIERSASKSWSWFSSISASAHQQHQRISSISA